MNGHADPSVVSPSLPTHSAPNWMDLLTLPHVPAQDTKKTIDVLSSSRSHRSEEVGWGLENVAWRANHIVYDPTLPTALLSHLKVHISSRVVPEPAKAAAQDWASHPHTDSARWNERLSTLLLSTMKTVNAIQSPSTVAINSTHIYSPLYLNRILRGYAEGADVMDRLLSEVVYYAKRNAPILWSNPHFFENSTWRLADIMLQSRLSWIILTGHKRSVLLHLKPHRDFIACSDLTADAPPNTLLPILTSAVLWRLSELDDQFNYPNSVDIFSRPLTQETEAKPKSKVKMRARRLQGPASDLEEMDIEIGFGMIGRRAPECYTLERTSSRWAADTYSGAALVNISTSNALQEDDNPNRRRLNGSDAEPVAFVLATSKIGSGTCGTVYYGTYGTLQLAIKVADTYSNSSRSERFTDECAAYEAMRSKGLIGVHVPRFFGMFKMAGGTLQSPRFVIITAYSGKAVSNFYTLSMLNRLAIYRAYKAIVLDARISQGSFSERNVVCDDNGLFRIIDFHRGVVNYSTSSARRDLREARDTLSLQSHHVVPLPCSGSEEAEELKGEDVHVGETGDDGSEGRGLVFPEGYATGSKPPSNL